MKLLRDFGLLRALRGLLLSGRRQAARIPRAITVPAPLKPSASAVVVELSQVAEISAARATAARAARATLQTRRNKVLLSRQA